LWGKGCERGCRRHKVVRVLVDGAGREAGSGASHGGEQGLRLEGEEGGALPPTMARCCTRVKEALHVKAQRGGPQALRERASKKEEACEE
jgi:hypothetical protein